MNDKATSAVVPNPKADVAAKAKRKRGRRPPLSERTLAPHQPGKPLSNSALTAYASPGVTIQVRGKQRITWHPQAHRDKSLLPRNLSDGINDKLGPINADNQTELVLGLDFGTSSTKVVIADRSTQKAYAVPFRNLVGIGCYLLPSQVSVLDGIYRLDHQGYVLDDLKLAMLGNMSNSDVNERVCAYLALIIRSARAWLFSKHAERYRGKDLVWSLALGQPADQSTSESSRAHFDRLGRAAWALAGGEGDITVNRCSAAWSLATKDDLQDLDVEVLVMPELAAQIHGFVSSGHFDPRDRNFYLMVDVGAGTVDACLFRVVKRNLGMFDFELFTNSVEANGAASMHRFRIDWWQQRLSPLPHCADLVDQLEKIKFPTELRGPFPHKYSDYFAGAVAHFEKGQKNPDEQFFDRLRRQVVGDVLFGAYKKNLLSQQDVKGVPYFLCGGGASHPIFQQIKSALSYTPGCTWLHAVQRELAQPKDLVAKGLTSSDYHRLSVAFGLSKLNLKKVKQVEAILPLTPTETKTRWDSYYVSKDAC
ncbi:MAG: hypothetical protein ACK4F8_08510 [Aquabacterium sp.]